MVQSVAKKSQRTGQRASQRAKQRQILEAASRVFRRQGLHATGMRDVAAELGMRVGNLYYYFENKQELLAFCQQDALAGLLQLAAWVESADLRADEKLHLLIMGHVLRLNEGTPGSLAHLEVEALEERWRAEIQGQRDHYESSLRDLLTAGIAAGIFRPLDVKTAARAILGAVNWTVKWFNPGGALQARDVGRSFAEQLVRGVMHEDVAPRLPTVELPALEESWFDPGVSTLGGMRKRAEAKSDKETR